MVIHTKRYTYGERTYTRRRYTKEKYAHIHGGEKYTQKDIHTERVSLDFSGEELFDFSN